MIEKIKTITYEVKSHGHYTTLSRQGKVVTSTVVGGLYPTLWTRPILKKLAWHLLDIAKCMKRIEREKVKKKMQNSQGDSAKP